MGTINMTLMMGEEPRWERVEVNWLVVDCETSYNAIIGKSTLAALHVAISLYLLLIKFPTSGEIAKVRGNQICA